MPAEVINRVHRLARRNPTGLEFRDGRKNIIPDEDDDDDSTYNDNDDDMSANSNNDFQNDTNVNIVESTDGPIQHGNRNHIDIAGVNN